MSKVDDVINELVNEKLLSLEGLTIINKLKESYTQLEKELFSSKNEVKQLTSENVQLQTQNGILNVKLKEYIDNESSVVEREKKITELELTSKFEKEKTSLVQSLFNTVFANNVVKTRVTGSVPIPVEGGGSVSGYVSSGIIDQTTEAQG